MCIKPRKKVLRERHTPFRMPPSGQGFHAHHIPGFQVDLWLIEVQEFTVLYRIPNLLVGDRNGRDLFD